MKNTEDPGSILVRKSSIFEPFWPPFGLLLGSFWRPFLGRVFGTLFFAHFWVIGPKWEPILPPFWLLFRFVFRCDFCMHFWEPFMLLLAPW